ncbi:hypothetical protein PDE_01263 [Penicillium oxalicum 114-2]|uniref:Uncharacterized protein n=1 Tax=Penicillium oxalicum (strain 114-2 / CGMCC 5302) TaxID=933388 RepID=S8AWT4_PENO1|nr:hypothetical protein PDE_01263 [Penicillium oxalicum 114-2]
MSGALKERSPTSKGYDFPLGPSGPKLELDQVMAFGIFAEACFKSSKQSQAVENTVKQFIPK